MSNTGDIYKSFREKCLRRIAGDKEIQCDKLAQYSQCRECPDYSMAGRLFFNRPLTRDMIDEWSAIIALPKEIPQKKDYSLVIFRAGTEWYSLKTEFLVNIVTNRNIHFVPHKSSRIFKGMANINGELLLCFSAAEALNSNDNKADGDSGRMIIMQFALRRYVLIVEELSGLISIYGESLTKIPVTLSKSRYAVCSGIYEYQGKKIGMIDEVKFFHALEDSLEG